MDSLETAWSQDIKPIYYKNHSDQNAIMTDNTPMDTGTDTDIKTLDTSLLDDMGEYTTPIPSDELSQFVFGLKHLSIGGTGTKRKSERDPDSHEETSEPPRKIKRVTKMPSINYKKSSQPPRQTTVGHRDVRVGYFDANPPPDHNYHNLSFTSISFGP
ncbi:hypothetical protein F4774DRAFT_409377 [Daldinia eschscholtzii]|nr:hypothetical protein F4774DRAFT_409377 [Daldinia eschscholtzii]